MEKYKDMSNVKECQNALLYTSTLELSLNTILMYLSPISDLFWSYIAFCILAALFALFVYVIYKSYFSPVTYVKELTDVGFDHIRRGRFHEVRRARAQNARDLGFELPPPYPNGWFCVAESRDLRAGDVRAVNVLGQNLCVYRGEDGQARVVDAYCPHLGANMAVGGAVRGACIECPFHKWRFNGGSGECVSVPGLDKPPRGIVVRTWVTAEADGAVWIWHDAEGRDPLWSMVDAPELETWRYRGRNEFVVNSHVQDIPENGADVAHLNAVHSPSVLTGLADKYPSLLKIIGHHFWEAEWVKGDNHVAVLTLNHDYKFGNTGVCKMTVIASQQGPGYVRMSVTTPVGPMLISQSVTPLSPLEQRVVHRFFSPGYNAPFAAAFVVGDSYMFERDVVIWNSKRYVTQPSYVRADRTIRAFRKWYSQFYSKSSVNFRDAVRKRQDGLDW